MTFLRGHADSGTHFEIKDPLAARLQELAAPARGNPEALLDALLPVREIFPASLADQPLFRSALREALQALGNGARSAIVAYAAC